MNPHVFKIEIEKLVGKYLNGSTEEYDKEFLALISARDKALKAEDDKLFADALREFRKVWKTWPDDCSRGTHGLIDSLQKRLGIFAVHEEGEKE